MKLAVPGTLAILIVCLLVGCAAPIVQRKLDVDESAYRVNLENYRLTAGDVVSVMVFQEPDMLSEQRIAQDGSVTVALVGRVKIGGLTIEQAAKAIEARLKEGVLVNPQVTVSVLEYAPQRFTIFGQVNAPGSYQIPSEEVVTLPTALAMAGGNSRIGNLRGVTVTRTTNEGVFEYKVNLLNPQGRQFIIKDGDLVTVPESLF